MFSLLYLPPNKKWYVHSHKLYNTRAEALTAANRFLTKDYPTSIVEITDIDIQNGKVWNR